MLTPPPPPPPPIRGPAMFEPPPVPPQPPPPENRGPRTPPVALVIGALVLVLVAAGLVAALARSAGDDTDSAARRIEGRATPSTVAPGTGSSPTTVAPGSQVPSRHQRTFDRLMSQVAEIRGLPWKEPLNLQVVSREELARRVRVINARDTDPAQLAAEEDTLKLLGLVPADLDYPKLLDDLYAEQVLGFYDPETKELVVGAADADEIDASTRFVIAHEMVHALTDQHFAYGPKTIALDDADKTEELAGYSALLEGDAVLAQTEWAGKHLSALDALAALLGGGGGGTDALERAPEYIRDALFFPYDEGLAFVEELHGSGGFRGVDGAYRKPPTSTEHIIFPSTYTSGQGFNTPALPDLAASTGCTHVRKGSLGVFDMRAMLDQYLSASDASSASQGWNGDTYAVVRCGSALGMADRWEMDRGTEPTRLITALGQWAQRWSGSGRTPTADGRFSGPSGAGQIVRQGNAIQLVLARDQATADRLVRALG